MRAENVMFQENILLCLQRLINSIFLIAVTTTRLLEAMAFSLIYGEKLF